MARKELIKRIILNKGALYLSYLKLIPILKRLGKDSLVLDCGANIGKITQRFAGTGARVIAFEPDPVAFGVLQKRFEGNANVECIQKGVWDKNAVVPFFSHEAQQKQEVAFSVASSLKETKINIDSSKAQTIEVIDLVEFLQRLGRKVNVIKMDIEGAETEVLQRVLDTGAYTLFDAMYVETHETKIPEQKEQLRLIKQQMKEKQVNNIKLNWL